MQTIKEVTVEQIRQYVLSHAFSYGTGREHNYYTCSRMRDAVTAAVGRGYVSMLDCPVAEMYCDWVQAKYGRSEWIHERAPYKEERDRAMNEWLDTFPTGHVFHVSVQQ